MPKPTIEGKITLDDSQAGAALRRIAAGAAGAAGKIEGSLGGAFRNVGKLAEVGALAGAAGFAALAASAAVAARGINQQFAAGRALQILSRQTGASVLGLAVLQEKFKTAGLSADGVGLAIERLQKALAGVADVETPEAGKRLQALGLNLGALQRMRPDQQFLAVGRAIAALRDPTQRTAEAMGIFGKSGAQLQAVFSGQFGNVPARVQHEAEILARNSAIFEAVAIRLERVGEIGTSFFAGAAERVSRTLLPVLDQFERVDLAGVGQRFGDAIAAAGQTLTGVFAARPEVFTDALKNGLGAAFAESGNVLVGVMKTGVSFFQNGMAAAIEGLGDLITAAMMKGFASPLAYLQAGLENLLEESNPASGRAQYRDPEQEARLQKKVDLNAEAYHHPERRNVAEKAMDAVRGMTPFDSLAEANRNLAEYRKLPLKESVADRYNRILKDGPRFGLVDGGRTAGQYAQQGKDKVAEGFRGAAAAFRDNPLEDVFGAGGYARKVSAGAAALRTSGAAALGMIPSGPGFSEVAAAEVAGTNTRPETRPAAYRAQTLPHAPGAPTLPDTMLRRPSSAPSTPVPPTPWTLGGFLSRVLAPVLNPATTDPSPFRGAATYPTGTASLTDAQRAQLYASHTVGMGTALDLDPSTRPGWTGASNFGSKFTAKDWANYNGNSGGVYQNHTRLNTGGLGGGAYGATAHVMAQPPKDPSMTIAGHCKDISDKMDRYWGESGGGSSGSGGGATATGK